MLAQITKFTERVVGGRLKDAIFIKDEAFNNLQIPFNWHWKDYITADNKIINNANIRHIINQIVIYKLQDPITGSDKKFRVWVAYTNDCKVMLIPNDSRKQLDLLLRGK